jgi:hypothetical protein
VKLRTPVVILDDHGAISVVCRHCGNDVALPAAASPELLEAAQVERQRKPARLILAKDS